MKKTTFFIAILMCAFLSACDSADVAATTGITQSGETIVTAAVLENESTDEASTRIFMDDTGREVEIPSHIDRIIPSGPVAQLVLFAIAPEKFVGLASSWDEQSEGIIPTEYYSLPYYGQFYGNADMNIEELAKAAPQVVVDIGDSKKDNTEKLDDFTAQTGIPIVYIYADLENMDKTYERLGELFTDKAAEAKELSSFCSRIYSQAAEVMENVGNNKVKALYITGEEGLNVLAKGSYHAELLDMMVDNQAVLDDPSSKGLGNEVGIEQIALWNPDFIIFRSGSIYDSVGKRPVWTEISAVKNNKYVESPDNPFCWMGTPASVQRYLGLIWLPSVLYPEYCDYEAEVEIKEYYELFYHVALTDSQYADITRNAWIK